MTFAAAHGSIAGPGLGMVPTTRETFDLTATVDVQQGGVYILDLDATDVDWASIKIADATDMQYGVHVMALETAAAGTKNVPFLLRGLVGAVTGGSSGSLDDVEPTPGLLVATEAGTAVAPRAALAVARGAAVCAPVTQVVSSGGLDAAGIPATPNAKVIAIALANYASTTTFEDDDAGTPVADWTTAPTRMRVLFDGLYGFGNGRDS